MSLAPLVLLGRLAIPEGTEETELVRRGYELLPDARWLAELERDRAGSFLGLPISVPGAENLPGPLDVDFDRFEYDPGELYRGGSEDTIPSPAARRLSEGEKWLWGLLGEGMLELARARIWDGWIPPVKPLHTSK